eukprot:14500065-Ditylum_brightwellii.AAC.1
MTTTSFGTANDSSNLSESESEGSCDVAFEDSDTDKEEDKAPKKKREKGSRYSWRPPERWLILEDALRCYREKNSWKGYSGILPHKSTLYDALKCLGNKPVTRENVFPVVKASLLTNEQIRWIQDV